MSAMPFRSKLLCLLMFMVKVGLPLPAQLQPKPCAPIVVKWMLLNPSPRTQKISQKPQTRVPKTPNIINNPKKSWGRNKKLRWTHVLRTLKQIWFCKWSLADEGLEQPGKEGDRITQMYAPGSMMLQHTGEGEPMSLDFQPLTSEPTLSYSKMKHE